MTRVGHYVKMAAAARHEEDKSHGRFAYAAAKVTATRIRDASGAIRPDGGAQLLANQVGMSVDSVENAARAYRLLVAIHQKRVTSLSKLARRLWRELYKSHWETAARECFKKGGHGDVLQALGDLHYGCELTHDEFSQELEKKYGGAGLPFRMHRLSGSVKRIREDLIGLLDHMETTPEKAVLIRVACEKAVEFSTALDAVSGYGKQREGM